MKNSDNIVVFLREQPDGYTYLEVDGLIYGRTKPGGEILVNSDLPTILRSEALISLTHVSMGGKDTTKIAELIVGFRKHRQSKET